MNAIELKIRHLREEIRCHANAGDTITCDILHSRIAVLEEAMAILNDEVETFEADLDDQQGPTFDPAAFEVFKADVANQQLVDRILDF